MNKKLNYFLLVGLLLQGVAVFAQDTTKRKTINITSSFKPVLRDAVKINFHASPAPTDSSKPRLAYNIPGQYLMLAYQPPLLKPVALLSDSTPIMRSDNYIKVGIGNVHQPYVKAGFSFGDGKNTLFNVFGDGYNSIGNRPFQKNSLASVGISGIVKTANNLEWSGKLGFKSDGYYLYGYQPDSLKFTKSDLLQRIETFEGGGALRNLVPTEFGLRYNPNIHFSVFSDSHSPKALEDNTLLILPLEKTIGENISFSLAFTASLTHYHPSSQGSIQNNLYYVSPAISYKTNNIRIKAELTPSWDNSIFHLLPNVLADITTNDQQFTLQFGLTGYYDKGSYQRFASLNPWLAEPVTLLNTRVQQGFAGFKGSINNHFTYSARAAVVQYWDMPLFVNDAVDGKTFPIRYEINLKSFMVHGEIAYYRGEQFTATAALTINQYAPKHEMKAWGLMPLEFTTTLRWQLLKDLWVKGDLLAFDGAPYLGNDLNTHSGQGAFDLNAGIEFRISRQVNLWLQMNNILNNKYERWHQYEVYGFNILGGVIYSFGQKAR